MLRPIALRQYGGILRSEGIDVAPALAAAGIDAARLDDTDYWLDVARYREALANMVALCGDGGIGLDLGTCCDLDGLGVVGYAAKSCATMRDSHRLWIELGTPLIGVLGRLQIVDEDARVVRLRVAGEESFGSLLGFVVEETLSLIQATGRALVGRAPEFVRLSFRYPAPLHADRYREAFDCSAAFGSAHTEIVVARNWFEQPLLTRDAESNGVLRQYCRELLHRAARDRPTSSRLETWLSGRVGAPSLDEAACGLNLSARSLRRRLQEEDTSYRAELDRQRAARAREYLRCGRSVADTGALLGFRNAGSFRQAFEAWTGHSVGEFLEQVERLRAGQRPAPAGRARVS